MDTKTYISLFFYRFCRITCQFAVQKGQWGCRNRGMVKFRIIEVLERSEDTILAYQRSLVYRGAETCLFAFRVTIVVSNWWL